MKHLLKQGEMRPSAKTIYFIKQIAYHYRSIMQNGKCELRYLS